MGSRHHGVQSWSRSHVKDTQATNLSVGLFVEGIKQEEMQLQGPTADDYLQPHGFTWSMMAADWKHNQLQYSAAQPLAIP
jgi:hypothetical protein